MKIIVVQLGYYDDSASGGSEENIFFATGTGFRTPQNSRENIVYPSQEFNSGTWTQTLAYCFDNAAQAPDGTTTACHLVWHDVGSHRIDQTGLTSVAGQAYWFSIYAKAAELDSMNIAVAHPFLFHEWDRNFDLSAGTSSAGSATAPDAWSMEPVTGRPGWYRCAIKVTAEDPGGLRFRISLPGGTGDGVSGIYIWGAQDEVDDLTSYIPTTDITGPVTSDFPTNTIFEPRLLDPGTISRYMFDQLTTGGPAVSDKGDIILNNSDGGLDYLIDYAFDGRELKVFYGEDTGSFPAQFQLLFRGTTKQLEFSWSEIRVIVRGKMSEVVNKPIARYVYLGNNALPNGVEGVTTDLLGQYKPVLFGTAANILPPCVNTSKLIYELSSGPNGAGTPTAVYDKGVALTLGSFRATLADLLSNTPSASHWDWCIGASGNGNGLYIRLGSSPAGQVTADANTGTFTPGFTANTILNESGGWTGDDMGDSADWINVPPSILGHSYDAGVWFPNGMNSSTIGEALTQLCSGIGMWMAAHLDGLVRPGQLTLFTGTPDFSFTSNEISTIERVSSQNENATLPSWRVILNWGHNYTVQTITDLAGAALSRIGFTQQQFRSIISADSEVLEVHPLSQDLIVQTELANQTIAQLEADRQLALYKERRDIFIVNIDRSYVVGMELGHGVELTLDRYGMGSGRKFTVIGINMNLSEPNDDIYLFG